jgi:hypothetical protein
MCYNYLIYFGCVIFLNLSKIEKEVEESNNNPRASKDVDFNITDKGVAKEKLFSFIFKYYSVFTFYLWRAAEIHIYHITLIMIAIFCFKRVNLLNVLLISSVIFSLLIDRSKTKKKYHSIYSGFIQIWASIFTLSSMVFQLKFVNSPLVFNCTVILYLN